MRALDRKLVRGLWRMRGQAIAIACVMAGGVATVVMSLGTLASLRETRDAFYERYRFAHVFARAKRAPEYLTRRIAGIPGVARVETRIVRDVLLDLDGMDEPARGRLLSLPEDRSPALNDVVVRRGRRMRPGHPDEVLVGEAFAEAHALEPGDTLRANVNGKQRTLRIVGVALSPEFVYAINPGELVPDNRRFGIVWMGRRALAAAFDLDGAFNDVALQLRRDASEAEVVVRLDRLLDPFGGVGAHGRREHVSDAFLRSEFDQLATMARTVPPIFLAVAAFLLNVVVTRLVETEREQIGVLKAVGYGNLEIGWSYLKLALAIATGGIVLGWGLGAWMGRGMLAMYGDYFRFPFLHYAPEPAVFGGSALVAAAAAAAGTLVAVRRAARLPPAVAMRPPPPPVYGGDVLEWLGIRARLRPPTRMIVRHLSRWPLRGFMTSLGVGFAVALLVSSLFFLDAIDETLDFFFFRARRQDVTITFTEARAEAVAHAVARLPGVLAAELYRAVPARLRHGHRSRLVSITGLDQDADLSRLLTADHESVVPPPSGLVLTRKLAEILGAEAGSLIQVEALEGARPIRQVPLGAVVDEYVGTAAYMRREALHRMMREGPVASGAHLLVDGAVQPALLRTLKETPVVQGVTVQRATLATFRDMIDQMLTAMVFFYILFASLIAVGVVYNSARIALAERARELATLRVLGFWKREVAYILLGELAIMTVVALPLGCLLGYGMAALMASTFSSELMRLPLVILPASYGTAVLSIVAATVLTAAFVGRRVTQLDLVQVLKTRE